MRLFILLLSGLLTGCGWNYAVKTAAPVLEAPSRDHPRYTLPNLKERQQMLKESFEIRLLDTMNSASQRVHIRSGKILSMERQNPRLLELEQARREGIPLGLWLFEVDPSGQSSLYANRTIYERVVVQHQLKFLLRHPQRGTALYHYLGPRSGVKEKL